MKPWIVAAVTGFLVAAAPAWAQKIESAQSEIAFTIRQLGVPVEGRFTKFSGNIAFDPKKPDTGKVAFVIDTASARFGAPETDEEAAKAPWFNAARFPQASLESTAIRAAGSGKYEVAAKLSIKGAARDVSVPVTLTKSGAVTFATGAFTIKRLDFKIGDGEWSDTSMVANEVQVKFKLALSGMAAL
ncbi:YceI family protein [Variovorax terrae]|uniref:YceI family protein n=1 Tax=Variovorax terrae TaxID=2923278 RepID=A0A9X1VQU8_9BURK|nr:YceI family protein [Variovorax terrae]MCJ0761622.1 YceI family protein [Variovorax terrae]